MCGLWLDTPNMWGHIYASVWVVATIPCRIRAVISSPFELPWSCRGFWINHNGVSIWFRENKRGLYEVLEVRAQQRTLRTSTMQQISHKNQNIHRSGVIPEESVGTHVDG